LTHVKDDGLLRPWGPLLGVELSKVVFKVVEEAVLGELKWDSGGDTNPPVGKNCLERLEDHIKERKQTLECFLYKIWTLSRGVGERIGKLKRIGIGMA
jgi:hypothetical protein